MTEMVEKELSRLVEEGTLEPVQFASWVAPIVPVLKSDKSSARICGDFKQTVNPVSKLDRHPIPKIEDLFSTPSKGKAFSKLDLSQLYQQLPLESNTVEPPSKDHFGEMAFVPCTEVGPISEVRLAFHCTCIWASCFPVNFMYHY